MYTCKNSSNELKMKKYITFLIYLCVFLPGCKKYVSKDLLQSEQTDQAVLIESVDIFNGRDRELLPNRWVLIEQGRITQITDDIPDNLPPSLHRISGSGKTLMPGLIDAHIHLSGSGAAPWDNIPVDMAYNLSAYLYAGITTVYDLGGLGSDLEKIANQLEEEKLLGPQLFHTHIPITVKNGHPIPLSKEILPWPLKSVINQISPTIDLPSEAPELIEKYLRQEVDYVKIICDQIPPGSPEMSFEQLEALVVAAHAQGKKAFVHIGSPENALHAVRAGADVLAHGIWRGKLTPTQADEIAQSGVPIIYTLAAFQNTQHIHEGHFHPSDWDRRLVPDNILSPVSGEEGKNASQIGVLHSFFEDVSKNAPHWATNFKLLYERNAPILIGTDSNLPGSYAGSSYYQELHALKAFGMSNFDLLTAATFHNAYAFLHDPDFGLVEEGKRADLLLVDGNPLVQLDLIQHPSMVMRSGKIVKRIHLTP